MSDIPPKAMTAALAARYGEPVDTYTWNYVAETVLYAAMAEIRADERERCADRLLAGSPAAFLHRNGLELGATTRDVLLAAAADIRKAEGG